MTSPAPADSPSAEFDAIVSLLANFKVDAPLADDLRESIYAIAYQQLQSGKHDNARRCFTFLVDHQPGDSRFWAGLGHSFLGLGEIQPAVSSLGVAWGLSKHDPAISIALGDALLAAEMPGHAASAYEHAALAALESNPELAARAEAKLELLAASAS